MKQNVQVQYDYVHREYNYWNLTLKYQNIILIMVIDNRYNSMLNHNNYLFLPKKIRSLNLL